MSKLPKLKVILAVGRQIEEIRDFEQGKYLPFAHHIFIFAEGQKIDSYEELLQLASQKQYKDKEYLEVWVTTGIAGG